MSEYELVSLLQTQISTIGAEIMDYFTILTAFLVAGYVAAHRLTRSMALFVIIMFVVSALFFVANVMGSYAATNLILRQLARVAQTGGGFSGAMDARHSPVSIDIVADVALTMMLGGILGGIYFFLQSRHTNRVRVPSLAL